MKKINIKSLLIAFVIITVFYSCKKNDTLQNHDLISEKEIIEKFTAIPQGQNPILQKIADKIKYDNDQAHFIADLAKRVGYPIWSASEIRSTKNNVAQRTESGEEYEMAFIPLSISNTQDVDGFLACKVYTDSVKINLYEDKDYALYGFNKPPTEIDAEDIAIVSTFLEYKAIGHFYFKVFDERLFNILNSNEIVERYLTIKNDSLIITESHAAPSSSLNSFSIYYINYFSGWDNYLFGTGGSWGGGYGGAIPPGYNPNLYGWWVGLGGNVNGWSNTVNYLKTTLGLNNTQAAWLNQNPDRAHELAGYIQRTTTPLSQALAISTYHINKAITDPDYNSFLQQRFITGNTSTVWWEDNDWLDNPLNFNLDPFDDYKKLTLQEKQLVKQFPYQAWYINKNKTLSFNMTAAQFPGAQMRNDKADAFRHCFFNTINTISVGKSITESFGNAHESEVPANLNLEKQMDLWNNDIGYLFGETFNTSLNGHSNNDNYIAQYIQLHGISMGALRYLAPINYNAPNFNNTGGILPNTILKPTNQ